MEIQKKVRLLLVDDTPDLREELKKLFEFYFSYLEINTPNDFIATEHTIKNNHYDAYLVDINLENWFNKDDNDEIIFEEKCNGIQIAKELFEKNRSKTQIAVYSSFLNRRKIKDKLNDLPGEIEKINKTAYEDYHQNISPFNEFFYKTINRVISIVSLIPKTNFKKLPLPVDTFISKKILKPHEPDKYFWTAGKFEWTAMCYYDNFNNIQNRFSFNSSFERPIDNDIEFIIVKEKTIKCPEKIIFKKIDDFELDVFDEIKNNFDIIKNTKDSEKTLINLCLAQFIVELFINKKIDSNSALEKIRMLDDVGKIEFSKYMLHQKNLGKLTEESLNKFFSRLSINNFPRIVEMHLGQVRKIEQNIAYVKLVNCIHNNNKEKLELFDYTKLSSFGIKNLNAKFEYSIFETKMGYSSHIEPI